MDFGGPYCDYCGEEEYQWLFHVSNDTLPDCESLAAARRGDCETVEVPYRKEYSSRYAPLEDFCSSPKCRGCTKVDPFQSEALDFSASENCVCLDSVMSRQGRFECARLDGREITLSNADDCASVVGNDLVVNGLRGDDLVRAVGDGIAIYGGPGTDAITALGAGEVVVGGDKGPGAPRVRRRTYRRRPRGRSSRSKFETDVRDSVAL